MMLRQQQHMKALCFPCYIEIKTIASPIEPFITSPRIDFSFEESDDYLILIDLL